MASNPTPPITLGSASPRRAALLDSLGVAFVVEAVGIDEQAIERPGMDPGDAVRRIARAKFGAFEATPDRPRVLLTADTLVSCDGALLGKPDSGEHLTRMLNTMSGRDILIATAVCVGPRGGQPSIEIVTTKVALRTLSRQDIAGYVATGAGMDKAGGLALQAEANSFIDRVDGCWSNVLGLPLCAVCRLLELDGTVSSDADDPDRVASLDRCSVELCGGHDR